MTDVFWAGVPLQQLSTHAWATPTGAAFCVSVISADGHEFAATIELCGKRWSAKSGSPQQALDAAAVKLRPWALDMTRSLRWFAEQDRPKQTGAKCGRYTMAHVPDTPEQAERMAKKRSW